MNSRQIFVFLLANIFLIVVSFGVLIPWLGFYLNDWLILFVNRYPTSEITSALSQTSMIYPGGAFQLLLTFIDSNPLIWHTLSLLFRIIAIFSFWIGFCSLWPGKKRLMTWSALILLVYPAFYHQALAVATSLIWLSMGSFFFSITFMFWSLQKSNLRIIWLTIGLLAQLLAYLIIPVLVIFEVIRVIVLWIAYQNDSERIKQVGRRWLPYFITATVIIFLRFWMAISTSSYTGSAILGAQFDGFQQLISSVIGLFFGSWSKAIEPSTIILTDRFFLISLIASIGAAVIVGLVWNRMDLENDSSPDPSDKREQVIGLGIVFVVLSLILSIWSVRIFQWIPKQDLAVIVGMYGASLLIVTIIDLLLINEGKKILLVSILIGIGVGYQLRNANDFRWLWVGQNRFYWQLYWRAPNLPSATLFLTDQENFEGEILPTAGALNFFTPVGNPDPDFWLADINNVSDLSEDEKSTIFENHPERGYIVITYQPSKGHCLWVLSPAERDRMEISKVIRSAIPMSDLDRIRSDRANEITLPKTIFGREPEHTWCYYYQKAELARQYQDWQTVRELAIEVDQQGFEPNNLQEWAPFFEAYLHTGNWSKARELGDRIYQANPINGNWLCSLISAHSFIVANEEQAQIRNLADIYNCNGNP